MKIWQKVQLLIHEYLTINHPLKQNNKKWNLAPIVKGKGFHVASAFAIRCLAKIEIHHLMIIGYRYSWMRLRSNLYNW